MAIFKAVATPPPVVAEVVVLELVAALELLAEELVELAVVAALLAVELAVCW